MGRLRVLQVHLPLQRLGYFLLLLPCFDGLCSYLAVSHRCPRINPPFSSGSICAHPSVVARYARFLTSCVRNASHWAPRLIFSFSFLRVSVPVSTALSSRISLPRSCFSLLSSYSALQNPDISVLQTRNTHFPLSIGVSGGGVVGVEKNVFLVETYVFPRMSGEHSYDC